MTDEGNITDADMRKAVWDIIEQRIETAPSDGIAAGGNHSDDVAREQRIYIKGMQAARLAAVNEIDRLAASRVHPVAPSYADAIRDAVKAVNNHRPDASFDDSSAGYVERDALLKNIAADIEALTPGSPL